MRGLAALRVPGRNARGGFVQRTWVSVPSTLVAHTTIMGLPALTTVSFRVSLTTTAVPQGDWSQAIALLVH